MGDSVFFPPPPPIVSVNGAQPYAGNKLPPSIMAVEVDQPPASWMLIPWWEPRKLPVLARSLNPGLFPVVVVNNPIPNSDYLIAIFTAIEAWQPSDPVPTIPRKLSPGIPGQSVDNPPRFVRSLPSWADQLPPFQISKYLPQGGGAVAGNVYNPQWLLTV